MSEYQIGALQEVANKILDAFRIHTSKVIEVMEQLRELPNLIKSLGKLINDGFNRQIQSNGDIIVATKVANVSSKRSLVDAENEAIEDFVRQLEEDSKEIEDRYGKIQAELNGEAVTRVRQLDDHLLGLYENHFPTGPLGVFNDSMEPLLEGLKQDSAAHYANRSSKMERVSGQLQSSIRDFMSLRSSFFQTLNTFSLKEKERECRSFMVPLWIVETASGKVPGSLRTSLHSVESFLTDSLGGSLKSLEEALNSPEGKEALARISWRAVPEFKQEFREQMEAYCQKRELGASLTRELMRVIDESTLQTVAEEGV